MDGWVDGWVSGWVVLVSGLEMSGWFGWFGLFVNEWIGNLRVDGLGEGG